MKMYFKQFHKQFRMQSIKTHFEKERNLSQFCLVKEDQYCRYVGNLFSCYVFVVAEKDTEKHKQIKKRNFLICTNNNQSME